MKDFHEVGWEPNETTKVSAQKIGYVTRLLSASRLTNQRTFRYIQDTINPAILADRLNIYFNRRGEAVGFIVWARFSQLTEQQIIADGVLTLHHSEWREEGQLWIIDIISPFNNLRPILRKFISENTEGQNGISIRYTREKKGIRYVREFLIDN